MGHDVAGRDVADVAKVGQGKVRHGGTGQDGVDYTLHYVTLPVWELGLGEEKRKEVKLHSQHQKV